MKSCKTARSSNRPLNTTNFSKLKKIIQLFKSLIYDIYYLQILYNMIINCFGLFFFKHSKRSAFTTMYNLQPLLECVFKKAAKKFSTTIKHIHTCKGQCIFLCIHMYVYVCMRVFIHIYIKHEWIYILTFICTYVCPCIWKNIFVCRESVQCSYPSANFDSLKHVSYLHVFLSQQFCQLVYFFAYFHVSSSAASPMKGR